jgi:hypothetical protein
VQTHDPLGTGRALGHGLDLERRGVGGQHAVVAYVLVELGEQLALDREVLENGLDDQIAVGQVGVGGRTLDAPENLLGLALAEDPPLHALVQHLADRRQTSLDVLVLEVHQHHLEPGLGGLLRDPAPHRPGTHDPDPLWGCHCLLPVLGLSPVASDKLNTQGRSKAQWPG